MSKNINNYLPKILQPILEFQIINNDLDVELDNLENQILNINKEVIVQTSSEYGIKKWEKSLGIIPSSGDSLSVRRFRIQNILTNKLPYTARWLHNKLTEITGSETAFTTNINHDQYKLTIILAALNSDWMKEVQKQLRIAIPANMVLEIGGEAISGSKPIFGIGTHIAYKLKLYS